MAKRGRGRAKDTSYNKYYAPLPESINTAIGAEYRAPSCLSPVMAQVKNLENDAHRDIFQFAMPEILYTTRDLARLFGKAHVTITKECREAGLPRRGHSYLLTQAQADHLLQRFEDKERRRQEQRALVRAEDKKALPVVLFKKISWMEQATQRLIQDRERYYRVFWEYINAQETFREGLESRSKLDFRYRQEVRYQLRDLASRLERVEHKVGVVKEE